MNRIEGKIYKVEALLIAITLAVINGEVLEARATNLARKHLENKVDGALALCDSTEGTLFCPPREAEEWCRERVFDDVDDELKQQLDWCRSIRWDRISCPDPFKIKKWLGEIKVPEQQSVNIVCGVGLQIAAQEHQCIELESKAQGRRIPFEIAGATLATAAVLYRTSRRYRERNRLSK